MSDFVNEQISDCVLVFNYCVLDILPHFRAIMKSVVLPDCSSFCARSLFSVFLFGVRANIHK